MDGWVVSVCWIGGQAYVADGDGVFIAVIWAVVYWNGGSSDGPNYGMQCRPNTQY